MKPAPMAMRPLPSMSSNRYRTIALQTPPNCAKLCWNPTESDMRLVGMSFVEYASKDWTYLDEDDEYYNVKIGY